MPPPWNHPRRQSLERRYDGPIPPFDPATPSDGAARSVLFGRLAARQRAALAGLAARRAADPRLIVWQQALRFYRDQSVLWGFTSR